MPEILELHGPWVQQRPNLASRVAEIMRKELRLVSFDGEPCASCGDIVDYSFKAKDGCIEKCADAIADLVFAAMASGDISTKSGDH